MRAAGMPPPTQVRASGGGTASALWRRILADVLDVELVGTGTTEGAAYGAALLATPAAGLFTSVDEVVRAAVSVTPMAEPGPDRAVYAERHALHRELYPALAPLFPRM
jgi:xylulokinase